MANILSVLAKFMAGAGAFAVSTVMAKSLKNKLWKGFWYGSAGMVAASRVYHNAHWVSDVFLGGIIGYSFGAYVVDFDKKSKRHIFDKIIQPWIGMNKVGLCVYIN